MECVERVDLFGLRALISDERGSVASADALVVARHLVLALLCCSVESRSDARSLSTVSHRDVSAGNVRLVLKMRSAVHLPSEFVTTEEDRELDTLIARCPAGAFVRLGGKRTLLAMPSWLR